MIVVPLPTSSPRLKQKIIPTDDAAWEETTSKTSNHIKRTVRQTMYVSAFLWACMVGWAFAKYVFHADLTNSPSHGATATKTQVAAVQQEDVPWISPLFRPKSV